MRWLYRLQQRLSITRSEAWALLTLLSLFLVGLFFQHVQSRPRALPGDPYAETDRLFAERAAALDSAAAPSGAGVGEAAGEAGAVSGEPDRQRTSAAARSEKLQPGDSTRIDINTASSAQLQRLPRIGPKMAARIIEHRTVRGPFQRVGDLERVRGIGEKTMEKLRPHLAVE